LSCRPIFCVKIMLTHRTAFTIVRPACADFAVVLTGQYNGRGEMGLRPMMFTRLFLE
jgi:hypothetical protein